MPCQALPVTYTDSQSPPDSPVNDLHEEMRKMRSKDWDKGLKFKVKLYSSRGHVIPQNIW